MFIEELTLRAWLQVEENKRRTLQRNDVASAVSKCDQFDFLIDIVPREEVRPKPPQPTKHSVNVGSRILPYEHVAAGTSAGTTFMEIWKERPLPAYARRLFPFEDLYAGA